MTNPNHDGKGRFASAHGTMNEKASGHNAGKGNRAVASQIKIQHSNYDQQIHAKISRASSKQAAKMKADLKEYGTSNKAKQRFLIDQKAKTNRAMEDNFYKKYR